MSLHAKNWYFCDQNVDFWPILPFLKSVPKLNKNENVQKAYFFSNFFCHIEPPFCLEICLYAQKFGHKDHLNKRRLLKGIEMHIIKNQSL